MKRVFGSNQQVEHLWANQSQAEGRASTVFFEGKSIYSYGYHYELGRMVTYKGKTVAMINTTGYSSSTSKHISQTFSAVSHLINLGTTGDLSDVRGALVEKQGDLISELFDHFSRLTFWSGSNDYTTYVENSVKEFNALCVTLGHKELALDINPEYLELYKEHIKRRLAREIELQSPENLAKREKQVARKEELFKIKIQDEIVAWRSGGPLTSNVRAVRPQLIRIMTRMDNGEQDIQTTLGATVPFKQAKVLLTRLLRNEPVDKGYKIGSFKLESCIGDVVTIGCHTFSLKDTKETFDKMTA